MGMFSVWHWVIVLVLLSPVILALALMGLQRKVLIRHAASGLVKSGYVGFSWTYLFFGWLVPVFRGEIGIGVLHMVLTFVTFGLFQLIMAFLYNRQYMVRQLTSGWELCDSDEANARARAKLGILA